MSVFAELRYDPEGQDGRGIALVRSQDPEIIAQIFHDALEKYDRIITKAQEVDPVLAMCYTSERDKLRRVFELIAPEEVNSDTDNP